MVDVRQLELVRALAEHGSLSAAARDLGFSQPALSQQVRTLEDQLRTPVVIRGSRGVELTEAGKVLLRHSAVVLDTISLARAEVEAVTGLRQGHVRVAAFPSAASTLVATAMATMTKKHPGVTFTLVEAEPPKALELLEAGDCDIAVVFRYSNDAPRAEDAFHWRPLLESEVNVALPEQHPHADSDEVDLAELWDSRWIAGCPDCRGHLTTACQDAGFSPDIAFETDDFVALQNLAARGLGVALVPQLVLSAVRVDGLKFKELVAPTRQEISAVSTPGLAAVPGVRETLRALESAGDYYSVSP